MYATPATLKRQWSRESTFIFAGVGAVLGFANIWRFPSLMAEHGGLVFLLAYLLALLVLACPLLMLEIAIGKSTRKSPVNALQDIGGRHARFSLWKWAGLFMIAATALTVVVYSIVAGMGLAYAFKSAFGEFNGIGLGGLVDELQLLQKDVTQMLGWLAIFAIAVYIISLRGIHRGLETAVKYFVPLILVLACGLLIYSWRVGNVEAAWQYMFSLDSNQLSWGLFLDAFKHAFFSLAVGTGVMLMLGAYMPEHTSITRSIGIICSLDLLLGVLSGAIVLPWLFQLDLPAEQGFALAFQVLPYALGQLPLGQFFGAMFFVFMTVAAWSSAIFLIEPVIAWVEEETSFQRRSATTLVHLGIFGISAIIVQTMGAPDFWSLGGIPVFSMLQFLVATFLLPVAGFLLAILCCYVLPVSKLATHLNVSIDNIRFQLGFKLLRYISVPILVLIQIALVFDLMISSCRFEGREQGTLCVGISENGSLESNISLEMEQDNTKSGDKVASVGESESTVSSDKAIKAIDGLQSEADRVAPNILDSDPDALNTDNASEDQSEKSTFAGEKTESEQVEEGGIAPN